MQKLYGLLYHHAEFVEAGTSHAARERKDVFFSFRSSYSGVTIGRARRAVHAGPALWGAQNLPDAVFFKVMLALYITINLEIRSLDYENRNCNASNEQFQSAHSSLLLTENVLTCWINDFVGVP